MKNPIRRGNVIEKQELVSISVITAFHINSPDVFLKKQSEDISCQIQQLRGKWRDPRLHQLVTDAQVNIGERCYSMQHPEELGYSVYFHSVMEMKNRHRTGLYIRANMQITGEVEKQRVDTLVLQFTAPPLQYQFILRIKILFQGTLRLHNLVIEIRKIP